MKALIVDDEYIVVKGLMKMIDWESYGIEIVGTAEDGLTALQLFEEHCPDIVFSDIRMPGMDGLTLIEKILQISPQTICVVFSGFNEFEYVKKALKLGVIDYLEKPITISNMNEVIKKILLHSGKQHEIEELRHNEEMNKRLRIEQSFMNVLLHKDISDIRWKDELDINEEQIEGVIICVSSDEAIRIDEQDGIFEVIYITEGVADQLIIILIMDVKRFIKLEQYLFDHSNGLIAKGSMYTSISEAYKSYEEAVKTFRASEFFEKTGVISFKDSKKVRVLSKEIRGLKDEILHYFSTFQKQMIETKINQFILLLEKEQLHPDVIEGELLHLLYVILEFLEGHIYGFKHFNYTPQVELRKFKTKSKFTEWLHIQLNRVENIDEHAKTQKKNESVDRACSFIQQNYNKDISLQEVAEYVDLNPNYLSVLFKEVMGMTFIRYVTEVRMEMAKLMLKNGETVADVSKKVGYNTYRHFSELFKKYTGVSPGKYKKEQ